ncbi:hypothetical protein EDB83DRAFT_877327 [Lactarius deliciosus]|nr:hypothetical protein EDB83DRAFT_877327 [Lactarius deliciosus]
MGPRSVDGLLLSGMLRPWHFGVLDGSFPCRRSNLCAPHVPWKESTSIPSIDPCATFSRRATIDYFATEEARRRHVRLSHGTGMLYRFPIGLVWRSLKVLAGYGVSGLTRIRPDAGQADEAAPKGAQTIDKCLKIASEHVEDLRKAFEPCGQKRTRQYVLRYFTIHIFQNWSALKSRPMA